MKLQYQLFTVLVICISLFFTGCDFEESEKMADSSIESSGEMIFSLDEEGIKISLQQRQLSFPVTAEQGSAKGSGMIQRLGSLRNVLAYLDKDAEYIITDETLKERVFKAELQFDENKRNRAIELFLEKADSAFEIVRVPLDEGDLDRVEERLVYGLRVDNEELLSSHSGESELSTGQMSRVELRRGELYAVQINVSELAEILSDQLDIIVHAENHHDLRFTVGLNLNRPFEEVIEQLADEYGLILR